MWLFSDPYVKEITFVKIVYDTDHIRTFHPIWSGGVHTSRSRWKLVESRTAELHNLLLGAYNKLNSNAGWAEIVDGYNDKEFRIGSPFSNDEFAPIICPVRHDRRSSFIRVGTG